MELLPADNQRVADLPADDQDNNFIAFDIVQDPGIARAEFELRQGVRPQLLDGPGKCRGLVLESRGNGGLQDPLIPCRQRSELLLGGLGDRDTERHRAAPWT
jgi:hypothetical protein